MNETGCADNHEWDAVSRAKMPEVIERGEIMYEKTGNILRMAKESNTAAIAFICMDYVMAGDEHSGHRNAVSGACNHSAYHWI